MSEPNEYRMAVHDFDSGEFLGYKVDTLWRLHKWGYKNHPESSIGVDGPLIQNLLYVCNSNNPLESLGSSATTLITQSEKTPDELNGFTVNVERESSEDSDNGVRRTFVSVDRTYDIVKNGEGKFVAVERDEPMELR